MSLTANDESPKPKKNALLKNLEIDDLIHSQFVRSDTNGHRTTRRLFNSDASISHRIRGSVRSDKGLNKIKKGLISQQSKLPSENSSQNIVNRDNKMGAVSFPIIEPNIEVSEELKVRIKYDSIKFFNFERLISKSSVIAPLVNKNITSSGPLIGFQRRVNRLKQTWDLATENMEYPYSSDNTPFRDNDSWQWYVPYGGTIKKMKDFSTKRTLPTWEDKIKFLTFLENSKSATYINGNVSLCNHNETDQENEDRKKRKGKVPRIKNKVWFSQIEYIVLRNYEIKPWYTSPFPEHINQNKMVFICEFCLKYMTSRYTFYRHQLKCLTFKPPGNEIYREGKLSVWEIDGRENVLYCQNLCLLAKCFINSKTLYYDVEPFIFYILTEREDTENHPYQNAAKFHFVGYFSKEKFNSNDYNLSCILTLPIYQRKGYGQFLMEFSYLLSRKESKFGTPEKPLSDLGLLTYRTFWKIKCAEVLLKLRDSAKRRSNNKKEDTFQQVSLNDMAKLTGMIPTDVVFGLEQLQVLYRHKTRSLSSLDDFNYIIKIDSWNRIENIYKTWSSKNYPRVKYDKLLWEPIILGPSFGINGMMNLEPTALADEALTNETMAPVISNNTHIENYNNSRAHNKRRRRRRRSSSEHKTSKLHVNNIIEPEVPATDFFEDTVSSLTEYMCDYKNTNNDRLIYQTEKRVLESIHDRKGIPRSKFSTETHWELCFTIKNSETPLGNHAARRNDTGISSLEQDEVENDVDTELYVGENAKEDEDEDEDFTLDDDIEDEQISEENDEEEDTYEEDSDDDEDGKRKGQGQDENDIENHIRKERVRKRRKITLIEDDEE
ncbi:BAG_1a_G0001460.mRNA.1.CDS.1 [Saccharomyces cerevisiae]|nr:SX2_G0013630.mRNA.1.CDS.1 [Saccharomyces cerevisiae]CAI4250236.1 BAG_1a_G0001460.mRNA.1.CDS.1 [Saccharomyces cerevisiae]CAI7038434.1 BAG_1a_G0001460.mRNA.1.CDS.1 [Saccharomyces cerevisiae]